jgi:hypothetical protein
LRSHSYCFQNKNGPIANSVPQNFYDVPIRRVAIVSSLTPEQKAKVALKEQVRTNVVKEMVLFLEKNCIEYPSKYNEEYQPKEHVTDVTNVLIPNDSINPADRHSQQPREGETEMVSLVTDSPTDEFEKSMRDHLEPQQAIVYRSNFLTFENQPRFWEWAFPDLFPFGTGGYADRNEETWSVKSFVQYLLQLGGKRSFALHPTFAFVGFNIIRRRQGSFQSYLHCKLHPEAVAKASSVTKDELLSQLKSQQTNFKHFQSNQPQQQIPRNPNVFALENGIKFGQKSMWGSEQESILASQKGISMIQQLGRPHVFVTICPDSFKSLWVYSCGNTSPKEIVLDEALFKSIEKNATQDPHMCVEWFSQCMDVFIDVVLNYDRKSCSSRNDPGLFGFVKAFLGSVESQISANLHTHLILWLEGMPDNLKSFEDLLLDPLQKDSLLRGIDSVITNNLPGTSDPLYCSSCNVLMTALEPTIDAFKRNIKDYPRVIAVCNSCHGEMSVQQYFDKLYNIQKEMVPEEHWFELETLFVKFLQIQHLDHHKVITLEV